MRRGLDAAPNPHQDRGGRSVVGVPGGAPSSCRGPRRGRGRCRSRLATAVPRAGQFPGARRHTDTVPDIAGRRGIQHRDVPQAIVARDADVGISLHPLARYFAATYSKLCAILTVPGAEKLFSTIAMAQAIDPLRASAAKPFRNSFSEPFARSIRATASRR